MSTHFSGRRSGCFNSLVNKDIITVIFNYLDLLPIALESNWLTPI